MTFKRSAFGAGALLALLWVGQKVAKVAIPMEKVPFDRWGGGLGPRLWMTWWFVATFLVAVFAIGHLLVRRLSPVPRDGAWALAFTSGTIVFAGLVGLFGWMGFLGFPFFWLLPLTLTLVGLPALRDALVDAKARWATQPAYTALETVAVLFGGACLGLLLLQVISPDNVNFDAMWYHLRSAERAALAGAIERTPEGDMLLSLPSATSWLYTWAFLGPGLSTDDKVILALHLELIVYVGTLLQLPPLVRALVPGQPKRATRIAWVALFFFPSVFIYDTGLMGGADHMVALWAPAVVLAWLQARERDDAGSWALVGLQLAGLTAKYSSIYLVAPLVPVMVVDALLRMRRDGRSFAGVARGFGWMGAVALLVTVAYWLRNLAWYHNPVYPAAAWLFPNTPWIPDAAAVQRYYALSNNFTAANMAPLARVEGTLWSMIDYPSKIYGWKDMMGGQPVMGAGYLLSLAVLPFVPERRRLLLLALLVNAGIMVWFNTHQHHMRYLTVLTPLMAAGMAATALSLWELGWFGRAGVLGTTALLLTAYGDVPFRQTHRIWRKLSPVEAASDYIAKRGAQPGARIKLWTQVGAALPPKAKPLIHGVETHLGLPRDSVTDCTGLQFGLNYGRLGSVAEVWKQLRQMGVTHVIWSGDVEQPDSISGEALLMGLAKGTLNQQVVNGLHVGELPELAPPPEPGTHVMYLGCSDHWRDGIYPLSVLAEPLPPMHEPWPALAPYEPLTKENYQHHLDDPRLGYVAIEDACKLPSPAGYVFLGSALQPGKVRHYVRVR